MAISLYRKYRPQTFDDVVGQEHVEKTLMNAVKTGTPSHAYLFCGPRGTGKTTTARVLAKALLCEKAPTPTPCGTCEQCQSIAEGTHPDVHELDAASRTGVDNIREEIISRVKFAPTHGAYKVYIIDEVHMLSTTAFNALLLTLEEPPAHIVFILCTTDAHKVPATIISRCQRFDFKRLSEEQITSRLAAICKKEGFSAEPAALELIAARSQGGMRDAIGALEQVATFGSGKVSFAAVENLLGEVTSSQLFELAELVAARDVAACFAWVDGFAQSATDIALFTNEFAAHMRNLYAASAIKNTSELCSILGLGKSDKPTAETSEACEQYQNQARAFGSPDRLAHILGVLGDLSVELKSATNARLTLEIALTRMVRPASDVTLEALASRVALLEQRSNAPAYAPLPSGAQTNPVQTNPMQASSVQKTTSSAKAAAPLTGTSQAPASSSNTAAATASGTHRLWLEVEAAAKKKSKVLGSFLTGSEAEIDEGKKTITITLPGDAGFTKKKLESPDNLGIIKTLIAEVSGTEYQPVYVLGNQPAEAPASPLVPDFGEPAKQAAKQKANEAEKEQLEQMLSSSMGSAISFEEL
ncbi:MAG: DNA polymerase III subunit gamma/tau [Coriobacteriales bacterium]|nr:DNA polymerase III subunit gamma/tau [Coriobacteriales bacterium]